VFRVLDILKLSKQLIPELFRFGVRRLEGHADQVTRGSSNFLQIALGSLRSLARVSLYLFLFLKRLDYKTVRNELFIRCGSSPAHFGISRLARACVQTSSIKVTISAKLFCPLQTSLRDLFIEFAMNNLHYSRYVESGENSSTQWAVGITNIFYTTL